jgi:hypothetical protein
MKNIKYSYRLNKNNKKNNYIGRKIIKIKVLIPNKKIESFIKKFKLFILHEIFIKIKI